MQDEKLQYAKFSGALFPVGETMPRLPAGFYDLQRTPAGYGIVTANPVSDDLIDIAGTPADDITKDIAKFLATKERYMKVGLTHKRGYLFYGPPGTGKTSLGLMIARRFIKEADGIVFYISNSGFLRLAVETIRKVEQPGRPSMFLMEEADNFLNDTAALSILDGELSLAGAVFVAMTNYKEKMPPRIANRPGRFDRVTYIGAPPYRVQVEYLSRLLTRLGEDGHQDAPTNLADALKGLTISMAHLREAFISHVLMGVEPAEVRRRFDEMAEKKKDVVIEAQATEEAADDSDDEDEDGEAADDSDDEDEDGESRYCTECSGYLNDDHLAKDGVCSECQEREAKEKASRE